jgi:hypothetical protein
MASAVDWIVDISQHIDHRLAVVVVMSGSATSVHLGGGPLKPRLIFHGPGCKPIFISPQVTAPRTCRLNNGAKK